MEYVIKNNGGWKIKVKDKKVSTIKEQIEKRVMEKVPYNLNGKWSLWSVKEDDFGNDFLSYIKSFEVSVCNDIVKVSGK